MGYSEFSDGNYNRYKGDGVYTHNKATWIGNMMINQILEGSIFTSHMPWTQPQWPKRSEKSTPPKSASKIFQRSFLHEICPDWLAEVGRIPLNLRNAGEVPNYLLVTPNFLPVKYTFLQIYLP